MSGLVSPLTNVSRVAEPADVSTNSSDIAALTTALAAKADQTALDATNTVVHTRADATTVSNNVALISALHPGAGRGMMSTLEACARFLEEAAAALGAAPDEARALLRGLQPLLAHLHALSPTPEARPSPDPRLLAEWTSALAEAAASAGAPSAPPPRGLRRCCVCRVSVSTPLRMEAHLRGRWHCEAVARRHLHAVQARGEAAPPRCSPAAAAACRLLADKECGAGRRAFGGCLPGEVRRGCRDINAGQGKYGRHRHHGT